MSEFDFSTLITDRTNADVSALSALLSKKLESWTPEEVEKIIQQFSEFMAACLLRRKTA